MYFHTRESPPTRAHPSTKYDTWLGIHQIHVILSSFWQYELFDSDDLWSEHVYLLYGEPDKGGPQVYVWIGQYCENVDFKKDDVCAKLTRTVVSELKAAMGGWPVGPIHFVRELKEPEEFWDYFVLG